MVIEPPSIFRASRIMTYLLWVNRKAYLDCARSRAVAIAPTASFVEPRAGERVLRLVHRVLHVEASRPKLLNRKEQTVSAALPGHRKEIADLGERHALVVPIDDVERARLGKLKVRRRFARDGVGQVMPAKCPHAW